MRFLLNVMQYAPNPHNVMHHNLPMDEEMDLTTKNKPELKNSSSMQTDEIGQIDGVVIGFAAEGIRK